MEGYCCEDDEACEVGRRVQDCSKLKVIVVKMMKRVKWAKQVQNRSKWKAIVVKMMKRVKWAEQYRTALNGRLLL